MTFGGFRRKALLILQESNNTTDNDTEIMC